ncbi:MAG: hypothetical protein E5X65_34725 [Mesorhizobium sp.]|nr:MAG: hypothetical protein E5X65_34725 [Mesorhizobium sp.]
MIPTRSQAMASENRKWLEVIATFGGSRELEQTLINAELEETTDVVRLISLAHAAHAVAGLEVTGTFGAWYRDMGQRLLLRAADAIAVIEAAAEGRQAGALN